MHAEWRKKNCLMLCQSSVFPGRPVRVQPGRDGNRNLAQQTAQGNSRIARITILTYVAHLSCQTHTESFSDGFFFQSLPFWWKNQGLKSIVESTIGSPKMKKKQRTRRRRHFYLSHWLKLHKDTKTQEVDVILATDEICNIPALLTASSKLDGVFVLKEEQMQIIHSPWSSFFLIQKAYLESFHLFCENIGGVTRDLMCPVLEVRTLSEQEANQLIVTWIYRRTDFKRTMWCRFCWLKSILDSFLFLLHFSQSSRRTDGPSLSPSTPSALTWAEPIAAHFIPLVVNLPPKGCGCWPRPRTTSRSKPWPTATRSVASCLWRF